MFRMSKIMWLENTQESVKSHNQNCFTVDSDKSVEAVNNWNCSQLPKNKFLQVGI